MNALDCFASLAMTEGLGAREAAGNFFLT
jgi:hypothetical protein